MECNNKYHAMRSSVWMSLSICIVSAIDWCSGMNQPINWSQVTNVERQYSYPAFMEVARSQCDLTNSVCDVSCCSDADCSADQKLSFDCLGGLGDGGKAEVLPSWNCQHQSLESDNFWVPLLCYVITNTPYLGKYFATEKKIVSITKINRAVTMSKKFNYKQLYSTNESSSRYYKFGSPIKTKTLLEDNIYEVDYLKMPRNIVGGGICSDSVELKYLENINTKCLRKLSKEQCEIGYLSPLSALNYMVSDTSLNSSAHFSFPQVSRDYLGMNLTETKVKYLCHTNGSEYLTFSRSIFKREITSASSINQQTSSVDCYQPSDTLFSTFYNQSSEICQNVLVSVMYNFKWNNSNILNLEATYTVADIPVTPDALLRSGDYAVNLHKLKRGNSNETEFYVPQRFVATFEHDRFGTTGANSSEEQEVVRWRFYRSGNPGYELGLPLLVWKWIAGNESVGSLGRATLSVWQNGHGGCRDTRHVMFGFDVTATCSVTLQAAELTDCVTLRSRLEDLQESLVSGRFIAGGGAFPDDPRNASARHAELVPILRGEDILHSASPANTSNVTVTEICDSIPTSLVTHVLYTTVVDASGRPLYRVVGAKTSYISETWSGSFPAGHRLVLTSSVKFVPVSVEDVPPTSRFWQHVTAPDQSDTAWLNMLHVLDDVMSGDIVFMTATASVTALVTAAVLSRIFKRVYFS